MKTNKVIWSEGLFLRPQLFQQQERYFEYFAHQRAKILNHFFWGFSEFDIDREGLAYGKLVLRSAKAVLPDGTPYDIPDHADIPDPLTILPEHIGKKIYLAVPLRLDNSDEIIFTSQSTNSLARFQAKEAEIADCNAIRQGAKPIQIARLRLKFMSEDEINQSWIGLPIAKVQAIQPDGNVLLNDLDFIPPITSFGASALLLEWLTHLSGLVKIRATMLAERLSSSSGKASASAEIVDYFILQMFNKYEPVFNHLRNIPELSPVDLYLELAKLAGELSTFVRTDTRRPALIPDYNHADIYASIKPLIIEINNLLNQILVRAGQIIDLQDRGQGVWVASVMPAELQSFSHIVLAVHADMAMDKLDQHFRFQSKLSAPQQLNELVRSHLPGIELHRLPVPPRQIPYSSGHIYYELQKNGPLWERIAEQGALALHVAGQLPGLTLELWGIRS